MGQTRERESETREREKDEREREEKEGRKRENEEREREREGGRGRGGIAVDFDHNAKRKGGCDDVYHPNRQPSRIFLFCLYFQTLLRTPSFSLIGRYHPISVLFLIFLLRKTFN
jgi:hypothetical protein